MTSWETPRLILGRPAMHGDDTHTVRLCLLWIMIPIFVLVFMRFAVLEFSPSH